MPRRKVRRPPASIHGEGQLQALRPRFRTLLRVAELRTRAVNGRSIGIHMRSKLKSWLFVDDLFVRALFFLWGAGLVAGGVAVIIFSWRSGDVMAEWGPSLLAIVFGVLIIGWGFLSIGRCLLPRSSNWSRLAENFHPDTVDLEGGVLLLLLIVLPAVLLTLALRSCGVRGQELSRKPDVLSRQ
jgi:hypothetical protein